MPTKAILHPSKDSQWYMTDNSGWLEARLSKSTVIDSIRLISQEKLDGYYRRIPFSVTFEGYRGNETIFTIFTTPAQKISWSASSEHPESMIALASKVASTNPLIVFEWSSPTHNAILHRVMCTQTMVIGYH